MKIINHGIFLLLFLFSLNCERELSSPQGNDTVGISESEIRIGVSAALSGPAAFLGNELIKGSRLYIDKINEEGGLYGRKIRLVIYDDTYEPKIALENTIRLIERDKVFILFDYVGTPTAKAVLKKINDSRIPIVGLFTGAEFLRTPFQPFVFNVRASYYDEAIVMVDRWIAEGKKRFALFKQNDAFGQAVEDGAELALARHNLELGTIATYERGKLPDEKAVKSIVNAKPEGVIMVGTNFALAKFVDMAYKAGLKSTEYYTVSFVGSEAFAHDLKMLGVSDSVPIYVTQVVPPPDALDHAISKEFSDFFLKAYPNQQKSYVALEGYVNAKILVEGIKRCGKNLSRSRLRYYLEKMEDFDLGANMSVRISPSFHSFFDGVYITRYKNEKFEF